MLPSEQRNVYKTHVITHCLNELVHGSGWHRSGCQESGIEITSMLFGVGGGEHEHGVGLWTVVDPTVFDVSDLWAQVQFAISCPLPLL